MFEMESALRAANESGANLVICSFAGAPDGEISPGMPLVDAFAKLHDLGAKIVGANCTNGPQGMAQMLENVPRKYILSAYPNAGLPEIQNHLLVLENSR